MKTLILKTERVAAPELRRWLPMNGVNVGEWTPETGDIDGLATEMQEGKSKVGIYEGKPSRLVKAVDVCFYRWSGDRLLVLSSPVTQTHPRLATLRACAHHNLAAKVAARRMLIDAFPSLIRLAKGFEEFHTGWGFRETPRFPGLGWYVAETRFAWQMPSYLAMHGALDLEVATDWFRSKLEWVPADPTRDRELDRYAWGSRASSLPVWK